MVIGFAVSLFGFVVAQRSPARIVFLTFILEIISWCVLIYCILWKYVCIEAHIAHKIFNNAAHMLRQLFIIKLFFFNIIHYIATNILIVVIMQAL